MSLKGAGKSCEGVHGSPPKSDKSLEGMQKSLEGIDKSPEGMQKSLEGIHESIKIANELLAFYQKK